MARVFDSTAKYLSTTTCFQFDQTAGTIAVWFKPTWAYNDGNQHTFFNCSGDGGNQLQIQKNGNSGFYAGWVPGGSWKLANFDASGILQNQWNLLLLTYTTTVQNFFLNGKMIIRGDSGVWDTTNRTITIGTENGSYTIGSTLAHFMVWSKVLSFSEILTLWSNPSGGANSISSLLHHYAIGVASPETDSEGGPSLTVNGSAATADGPGEETLSVNALVSQVAREILVSEAAPSSGLAYLVNGPIIKSMLRGLVN